MAKIPIKCTALSDDAKALIFNIIVLKRVCRTPAHVLEQLGRPPATLLAGWRYFINCPNRHTLFRATRGDRAEINGIFETAEKFAQKLQQHIGQELGLSHEDCVHVLDFPVKH